jgi:predicted Zn-dependent peptidase
MIGRLLRSTETAIASARFYGSRWRAGLPLETPDERAEAIMKVTAAEVQAMAEEIVSGIGEVRFALVGPTDQGEELLSAIEATSSS